MATYLSNHALEDKLKDLHRGLHIAMDALIDNKDSARTAEILRQIGHQISQLLNNLQVVTE